MATDNSMAALYVNCFRIGHNSNEFVVEGCQAYEDSDRLIVISRLVITPQTAKELHRLLGTSLKEYEQLKGQSADEGF